MYYNTETDDIITIECADLGEIDGLYVFGDGESEEVFINGCSAFIYWGEGSFSGTGLVMIDKASNMVITIQTGSIDPEIVTRIAESIKVVDCFSL